MLVRIADWIESHARCVGRITQGETVPASVVQLPVLQVSVRDHGE
ncbi:hypothetical protein ACFW1A_28065 [Kitasatospora sp. NPDC058965]